MTTLSGTGKRTLRPTATFLAFFWSFSSAWRTALQRLDAFGQGGIFGNNSDVVAKQCSQRLSAKGSRQRSNRSAITVPHYPRYFNADFNDADAAISCVAHAFRIMSY